MLCFILRQAAGIPTGLHGPFHRWSVDAVTVRAASHAGAARLTDFVVALSEMMESVFRSCSNLVERLNRSYYYYLMVSAKDFVPIEIYTVPIVMVLLSIMLKVIRFMSILMQFTSDSRPLS